MIKNNNSYVYSHDPILTFEVTDPALLCPFFIFFHLFSLIFVNT